MIEEMPFSIQRIQTDRGQEFFAYDVQDLLKELKIKFRPIKPRSPHLNGKVERTQRTDLDEFYSSINPKNDPELKRKLKEWQSYYNTGRSHTSLDGKTPFEKYQELKNQIPTQEEINQNYDDSKEMILPQSFQYSKDLKFILELKRKNKNKKS